MTSNVVIFFLIFESEIEIGLSLEFFLEDLAKIPIPSPFRGQFSNSQIGWSDYLFPCDITILFYWKNHLSLLPPLSSLLVSFDKLKRKTNLSL